MGSLTCAIPGSRSKTALASLATDMPNNQSAGCLAANSGYVVSSPIIDSNTEKHVFHSCERNAAAPISQASVVPLPIMITSTRTRMTDTNNGSCLPLSSDLSTSADSDSTAREEPWSWQTPMDTELWRSPASAGCSAVLPAEDISREDDMGSGYTGSELETMLLDQGDLENDSEIRMEELTLHQSNVRETFTPIRRLPAEVLLMIFDVLCSVFHKDDMPQAPEWDGPLRHTAPLRLSMVCATWNTLISHTERFWRVIALDVGWSCDQEELQILVQLSVDRSGTAGLHVYVFSFTDDDMDELDTQGGTSYPVELSPSMRLLIGEAHRWQSLCLMVSSQRTVHYIFRFLPESLPQLASLTIGDMSEPSEYNPIRCAIPSMPTIKHLAFPLSFPSTSCIHSLPLTQIESLDVGLAAAQLPPFLDVVKEESMPCLTTLKVGGYHTPGGWEPLSSRTKCAVHSLVLEWDSDPDMSSDYIPAFLESIALPQLKHLRVIGGRVELDIWEGLLKRSQTVAVIELGNCSEWLEVKELVKKLAPACGVVYVVGGG